MNTQPVDKLVAAITNAFGVSNNSPTFLEAIAMQLGVGAQVSSPTVPEMLDKLVDAADYQGECLARIADAFYLANEIKLATKGLEVDALGNVVKATRDWAPVHSQLASSEKNDELVCLAAQSCTNIGSHFQNAVYGAEAEHDAYILGLNAKRNKLVAKLIKAAVKLLDHEDICRQAAVAKLGRESD